MGHGDSIPTSTGPVPTADYTDLPEPTWVFPDATWFAQGTSTLPSWDYDTPTPLPSPTDDGTGDFGPTDFFESYLPAAHRAGP